MPPSKGKAIYEQDLANRVVTRAKNANVHPGTRAKDALRVNRPQEEIQKEKDVREAKKLAREKQEKMEDIVADEIAEFENQAALAADQANTQFPTYRTGKTIHEQNLVDPKASSDR